MKVSPAIPAIGVSEDLERYADAMAADWEQNAALYPTICNVRRAPDGRDALTVDVLMDGVRSQVSIAWAQLAEKRDDLFAALIAKRAVA